MFDLKDYVAILIIINTLLKERHYILCTTSNKEIFIEVIVNLLVKKMFKIHELLSFIVLDREF